MPTLYTIEPKNPNSKRSIQEDAILIHKNARNSKFLSSCGCDVIPQVPFGRILIHIESIFLFDDEVDQRALQYMKDFLKNIGMSEDYYVSHTRTRANPYTNSDFLPEQAINRPFPLLTITLIIKENEFSLYRQPNSIRNNLDMLNQEISKILKNARLSTNAIYNANGRCLIEFMNLRLNDEPHSLLIFQGNVVLRAIKKLNLQDDFQIEGFDEKSYLEVQRVIGVKSDSDNNNQSTFTPHLSREDLALYEDTQDSGVAVAQKLSETKINSPTSIHGDRHESLVADIQNLIQNNPKYMPFMDSINSRAYSQALRRACTCGDAISVELVKTLFKYKEYIALNPNERAGKENPRAAIHHAAEKNKTIYLFLIDNGGDPDLRDNHNTAAEIYQKTFGECPQSEEEQNTTRCRN